MRKDQAVQRMTLIALLASLAIVIKIIFQLTTTPDFRFTLYEMPLVVTGALLGPLAGIAAGFVSDAVYGLSMGYGLNLMTLSSMMWGALGGVVFYRRTLTLQKIIVFFLLGSLLEFSINTVQLFIWEYAGEFRIAAMTILGRMPLRLTIIAIKWPVQVIVLHTLWVRILDTEAPKFMTMRRKSKMETKPRT